MERLNPSTPQSASCRGSEEKPNPVLVLAILERFDKWETNNYWMFRCRECRADADGSTSGSRIRIESLIRFSHWSRNHGYPEGS